MLFPIYAIKKESQFIFMEVRVILYCVVRTRIYWALEPFTLLSLLNRLVHSFTEKHTHTHTYIGIFLVCNIHTSYEEIVVSKMKLAAGLKEKRREKERKNFLLGGRK